MMSPSRFGPLSESLVKLGVVVGLAVGAWMLTDKPRLEWLGRERVAFASAQAQLSEAMHLADASQTAQQVRSAAQAQISAMETWASRTHTDVHVVFRTLARTRGVTIERMEPGAIRSARTTRDGRDAQVQAVSLDIVGEPDAVVGMIDDLETGLGASKVQSFRLSPLLNDKAGRVRATIDTLHVTLAPSQVASVKSDRP
jgi:pyruvate/2-oxoglutarate dehydrogenase complex dihydrolipoamide acyltransferase (E2) component